MAKEKPKGIKKKIIASLVSSLVPILIIVLIGGAFFAILNTLGNWLKDFTNAISDFLSDPVGAIRAGWAGFKNNLASFFNMDSFDEEEYEKLRTDPVIVISDEKAQQELENIKNNISQEAAGIDNIMLKKMLLAYYRGLYLDDTTILVELTQEDLGMGKCTCNHECTYVECLSRRLGDGKDVFCPELCDSCRLWVEVLVAEMNTTAMGAGYAKVPLYGLKINPGELPGDENSHYELRVDNENNLIINNKYGKDCYPFELIEGEPEKFLGDDGKIYLKTKGMIQIFVDGEVTDNDGNGKDDKCSGCTINENGTTYTRENCEYTLDEDNKTVCFYKIKYYSDVDPKEDDDSEDSPFTELYNHYLDNLNQGRAIYAEAVKDYLKLCYTYDENGNIKMYSKRITESNKKTWEYVKESEYYANLTGDAENRRVRKLTPTKIFPMQEERIDFSSIAEPYANPVEFMVDLLEITASKEFLNAFIETVGEDNYIQMRLYTLSIGKAEIEEESKTRKTVVEGTRTYEAKVVEINPEGVASWSSVDEEISKKCIDTTEINGNVTVSLKEYIDWDNDGINDANDDRFQVELFVNGESIGEKTLQRDFVQGDKYTFELPCTYDFIDESIINEKTETETTIIHYGIGITKLKTWYAEKEVTNIISSVLTAEVEVEDESNETGRKNETVDISWNSNEAWEEDTFKKWDELLALAQEGVKEEDRSYIWFKGKDGVVFQKEIIGEDVVTTQLDKEPNIFNSKINMNYDKDKLYSMEECLNIQYYWATQCVDESASYRNKYILQEKMSADDTNIISKTQRATHEQILTNGLTRGLIQGEDFNFSLFLGLFSNEDGEYKLGAQFTPVPDGKLVEYEDLYGNDSTVVPLLINGADMLDTLLRNHGCAPLADVMKEALVAFSEGKYNITNPEELQIYFSNSKFEENGEQEDSKENSVSSVPINSQQILN